jgi:cysteine desulfurase
LILLWQARIISWTRSWFCFYSKIPVYNPRFWWRTRKRTASWNRSLAPNCGYGKSIELSYANLEVEQNHITELKLFIIQLKTEFPDFKINGTLIVLCFECSLPFPSKKTAMLLFHLDMKGIVVSRGSACQSGSIKPSHVLAEMLSYDDLKPSLRIRLVISIQKRILIAD